MKNQIPLQLLSCIALFFSIAAHPYAEQPPVPAAPVKNLRVGVYNLTPLIFMDGDGNAQGLYIDVLNHIAEQENWQIEYVPCKWADCLAAVQAGELDILPSVGYTEERAQKLDYTRDFLFLDWGVVYRNKEQSIETVFDLEGKRVAALQGGLNLEGFKKLLEQFDIDVEIIAKSEYAEVLAAVNSGEADAGITTRLTGLGLEEAYPNIQSTAIFFSPVKTYFALPKGKDPELLAALDAHLATLKADKNSYYYKVLDKWLGFYHHSAALPQWVTWSLLGLGALLVIALLFSLTLRRQVAARTQSLEMEIQERKQAEEALRASEARLKVIFEHANDAIHIDNADDEIVEVNARMCRLMGYSRAELLKMKISDLQAPEVRANGSVILSEVKQHGDALFEKINMRRDGTRVPVEISVSRIESPQGDLYVSILRDISERKKADEALRANEEKFRTLVEKSPIPLCFVNAREELEYFNPRLVELFGYDLSEVPTMTEWWRLAYPDDTYRQQVLKTWNAAIEDSIRERTNIEEIEYRVTCKNGDVRNVEIGGVVLENGFLATFVDVTERKRTEESLRASEEKFRNLFEHAVMGIGISSVDGRVIAMNKAMMNLTGYTLDDFSNTNLRDTYVHPEDRESILAIIKNYGMVEGFEAQLKKKTGVPYWANISINRIQYDGADALLTTMADVSTRKQAEEALRESEARWRSLVQASPTRITMTDRDGKILFINRTSPTRTVETALDTFIYKYLAPDLQDKTREILNAVFDSGQPQVYESQIFRADGSTIWYQNHVGPVIENGRVAAAIFVSTDITTRKQAEEALKESEERWRRAIASSPVPIMIHAEDDQVLQLSAGWTKYSGYTIEDIPTVADWTEHAYGERTGSRKDYIDSLFSIDKTENNGEWTITAKNGSKRIWAFQTTPLGKMNQGKRVLHSMALDITERKRAEEQVDELNRNLEARVRERTTQLEAAQEQLMRKEKLAVLGQMAGSVGHELRNPLGVMSNAIYYLKMVQTDASGKVKEYLNLLEKNIHISNKIVNDLLDFTRVKSVEREKISISQLIRQALEYFPAPENVQAEVHAPADLPSAYADPHHVAQILGNFVLNACQAMKEGGKLTISASVRAETIGITVRDTGAGIPPENMKKLFEPLFTTKPKGIGLGLAVSKKLAEANEGSIEVESEVGAGSAFTLYLPLHRRLA